MFEELVFDEVDKDEQLNERLCSDRAKELFNAEPADPSFTGDILRRPPWPRRYLATGPLRDDDGDDETHRRRRGKNKKKKKKKKRRKGKSEMSKKRQRRGSEGEIIEAQADADDIDASSAPSTKEELQRQEEEQRNRDEEDAFRRAGGRASDPSGNAFALQFDDDTGVWHYKKVARLLEDVDPCEITWRGEKMAVRAGVATDRRGAMRLHGEFYSLYSFADAGGRCAVQNLSRARFDSSSPGVTATRDLGGYGSFSLSEEALARAERRDWRSFEFA